jgi:hypothetical protein
MIYDRKGMLHIEAYLMFVNHASRSVTTLIVHATDDYLPCQQK